jgi:hypothetical protein
MKKQDLELLEGIIDRSSPSHVLQSLSEICFEKAIHIRENWQDEKLAKQWEQTGSKIARIILL